MTTRQIEPLNLHDEPERPGGNGPTKPRSAYLARQMLIGGAWRDARSGKTLVVENPARREPIGEVPRAQAEDVDLAVEAAAAAFPAWAHTPPRERGRALLAIAEALEARLEELARLIASETGNAIRTQARGEARWVVEPGTLVDATLIPSTSVQQDGRGAVGWPPPPPARARLQGPCRN